MVKFLQLKSVIGENILINIDNIGVITKDNDDEYCKIHMANGTQRITVLHSYEYLKNYIQEVLKEEIR